MSGSGEGATGAHPPRAVRQRTRNTRNMGRY
jgi:hypothetical protein